jgi:hypothetical protein
MFMRRSVRDYCTHHGITRSDFLIAREAAKVRPRDWDSMLSVKDQQALLPHVNANRRLNHMRRAPLRPTVTTKPSRPAPPKKPVADVEADVRNMTASLSKWRNTLVSLAHDHLTEDSRGRCKTCRMPAPCQMREELLRLDRDLTERIAIADSGDSLDDDQPTPGKDPEWQLQCLFKARQRYQRVLVKLTVDHMIEDAKGHCPQCRVPGPCKTKRALQRINFGIARQIESHFATLRDAALDAKLGIAREEDDWDMGFELG